MRIKLLILLVFLSDHSFGQRVVFELTPPTAILTAQANRCRDKILYMMREHVYEGNLSAPYAPDIKIRFTLKDTVDYKLRYDSTSTDSLGIVINVKDNDINEVYLLKLIDFALNDYKELIFDRSKEMLKESKKRKPWDIDDATFRIIIYRISPQQEVYDAINQK